MELPHGREERGEDHGGQVEAPEDAAHFQQELRQPTRTATRHRNRAPLSSGVTVTRVAWVARGKAFLDCVRPPPLDAVGVDSGGCQGRTEHILKRRSSSRGGTMRERPDDGGQAVHCQPVKGRPLKLGAAGGTGEERRGGGLCCVGFSCAKKTMKELCSHGAARSSCF